MPEQVTVRVELGPYMLQGREVELLEVCQAVGEHARCELAFTRDPRAVASNYAALRAGDLADARLRVVFVADGGDECLAFDGRVRDVEIDPGATGAGPVVVLALSDSSVLGEHVDRQYLREQTPAALAGRFGVQVDGALSAAVPRDYVQAGVSAWAFLAQVAAEEGLQLRARWPRTPGGAADQPAEVGRGFTSQTHTITWGRELLRLSTTLAPGNAGVTGAFYDPAEKHDHRFRGVRGGADWLGGAAPVVAAVQGVALRDADGGDPGHVEPGRVGGVRARTLAEFHSRLELESARRQGAAVSARGVSTLPALRAGDRVHVQAAEIFSADVLSGELEDRTGVFGLIAVTHRWTGNLYANEFLATPWAGYHPAPAAAPGGEALGAGLTLGVVVANDDPKKRARVQVRYAWMSEGERTQWVRVTGLGGGNQRGLGVLPSVGDEVVLAAVAGDPEHPVVVGALWNGVDRTSHEPGRQVWITPAGNTLVFLEGEPGGGTETVELYSREANTWVQLTQKGPTGVPTVTVHSEGDLSLEAPNGEVRLVSKSYLAHVAEGHATQVGGAHTTRVHGAATTESGARLALKAGADVAVVAGGAFRAHAAGVSTVAGSQVTKNPPGAQAPTVAAVVRAPGASTWGPRPVPQPGPGRSTEDPRTPTRRELAAKAARASMAPAAAPAVPAPDGAPPDRPAPPPFAPLPPGGCAEAWRGVMAQTRAVLDAGGGDGTPAQKLDRNRAISAAYARLAAGDDRMRWAGLASVVSTQAHCAMQDADTAVGRADAAGRAAGAMPVVGPVLGAGVAPVAGMAYEVQDALYDTNREIFGDIYPNVAMYKQYGMAGVGGGPGQCGGARPDRPMAPRLQAALARIDRGDESGIAAGSRAIARYEQFTIVQDGIYDDPARPLLNPAMKINQVVSGIPGVRQVANALMKARKPEVAISADCGQGTPVPFPGDITVAQDRVSYYDRLMGAYLKRDQLARDAMGRVVTSRDPLTGGPDYTYAP